MNIIKYIQRFSLGSSRYKSMRTTETLVAKCIKQLTIGKSSIVSNVQQVDLSANII